MTALMIPASIGDTLPLGVRFYRVDGYTMAPTLRRGDVVAYQPGRRYDGEGLYVIDCGGEPDVYRCSVHPATRMIDLWHDARESRALKHSVDHQRFAEIMRGRVIAVVQLYGGNLDDMLPPPGTEW